MRTKATFRNVQFLISPRLITVTVSIIHLPSSYNRITTRFIPCVLSTTPYLVPTINSLLTMDKRHTKPGLWEQTRLHFQIRIRIDTHAHKHSHTTIQLLIASCCVFTAPSLVLHLHLKVRRYRTHTH